MQNYLAINFTVVYLASLSVGPGPTYSAAPSGALGIHPPPLKKKKANLNTENMQFFIVLEAG